MGGRGEKDVAGVGVAQKGCVNKEKDFNLIKKEIEQKFSWFLTFVKSTKIICHQTICFFAVVFLGSCPYIRC